MDKSMGVNTRTIGSQSQQLPTTSQQVTQQQQLHLP